MPGMAADEIEHDAVEDLRLFPIDRMAGFRNDNHFAAGNLPSDEADKRGRRREIRCCRS